MGAAKDAKTCTETYFDEVTNVGNLALNVFTYGTGKTANMVKGSVEANKLKELFENMKSAAKKSQKVPDIVNKGQGKFTAVDLGKSTTEILKADLNSITSEDMVRISSRIADLVSPSGTSGVVSAETFPKCSKIVV